MPGAQFVPVRRMRRKIAGCLICPGLADLLEARAIRGEMGAAGRKPCNEIAGKACDRPGLGDPEENPGTFAMALDKPGFDTQLEMAGNAGLRLAEHRDKLADGELGLGYQGKQAQPGGLA